MNASNENKESKENPKNGNPGEAKNTFLRDFLRYKNENELIELADSLASGKGKVPKNIREDMSVYSKGIGDRYKGVNVYDITYNDLFGRVKPLYTKVSNARNTLKNTISWQFDIDEITYNRILSPEIKDLNLNEIKTFLNSRSSLYKFISRNFQKNELGKPIPKYTMDFLGEFNINSEKVKSLSKEKQRKVIEYVDQFTSRPNSVSLGNIEEFLSIVPLNIEERKNLVESILPAISIEDAVSLGIITKAEGKRVKQRYVEGALDGVSVEDEEIKEISEKLENEEILVNTKNFNAGQIEKLVTSEKFKTVFKEETIKKGDDLKQEYQESLSRDLEVFQSELGKVGTVKGAKNFKKGAFLKVVSQDKHLTETTYFVQVTDDGEKSGLINFADKGTQKYNPSQSTLKSSGISYDNFLQYVTNGDEHGRKVLNISVFTPDEFEQKLGSKEIEEDNENPNFKNIGFYDEKIEARKEKLKTEGKSDEEIQNDSGLVELKNGNEDIDNKNELETYINKVDPDGSKYGLDKGVTFTDGESGFWEIIGLQGQEIVIRNLFKENDVAYISYDNFYHGFKKAELKRSSKSTKSNELIQNLSSSGEWKGFKIKNGQLIKEEEVDDGHGHKSSKETVFEYLVPNEPKNDDEMIKILKIKDGSFEAQFGTIELKKIDGKSEKQPHYKIESKKYTVSAGFLESWINRHKLLPKDIEKDGPNNIGVPHDHRAWSFINWWAQGFSVHNILQGFHDMEHSVEHYFEAGNKEKSSKFAMKAFSLLPYNHVDILGEIRASMKGDVEIEQKKRMEAAIEHLGGVDTPDAIEEIYHWLHYSNTPDYKIHAAAMYMIKKYGVLYAKDGKKKGRNLIDLKGTYAWYKALGGTPNDAFFKQIQKECESAEEGRGIPFSEEELVYQWLKKLGRAGVIRSRIHKEFKATRGESKQKEYDTGLKDGGDERGIEGRVNFTMGELRAGNYPNAIGGLQRVYEKGGPSYLLEKVPFIIAFSGISYDFDAKWTLDKMKNFPSNGWLSPILKLLSYTQHTDILNETILEIARRMSQIEGKPEIYSRALKIFDKRKSGTDYKQKIKETEAFYDEYGKDIMSALTMSKGGRESKYTSLIETEKDAGFNLKGEKTTQGNQKFDTYYNLLHGYMTEYKFEAEGVFSDMQHSNGIGGLSLYDATKNVLFYVTGGKFRYDKEAPYLINELKRELGRIGKTDFSGKGASSEESRRVQKKIAKKMIRELVAGMFFNHSGDGSIGRLDLERSQLSFLYDYGLNFKELYHDFKASTDGILNSKNGQVEAKFDEIVENIVNGRTIRNSGFSQVTNTISSTKSSISGVTGSGISGNKKQKSPKSRNDTTENSGINDGLGEDTNDIFNMAT